jgi:hypothetical protein
MLIEEATKVKVRPLRVVVQFGVAHFRRATIKIPDHPVACGATPPELMRGFPFLAAQDSPPGSGGAREGRSGRSFRALEHFVARASCFRLRRPRTELRITPRIPHPAYHVIHFCHAIIQADDLLFPLPLQFR